MFLMSYITQSRQTEQRQVGNLHLMILLNTNDDSNTMFFATIFVNMTGIRC